MGTKAALAGGLAVVGVLLATRSLSIVAAADDQVQSVESSIRDRYEKGGARVVDVKMTPGPEDKMAGSIIFKLNGTTRRSDCTASKIDPQHFDWTCKPVSQMTDQVAEDSNATVVKPSPFPDPVLPSKNNTEETKKSVPKYSIPTDYKIVDAADLYIGSRKYLGRSIMIEKMHCYYADVDDYRCMAPGRTMLAVFTAAIEPPSAREWIEKNCDQLKKMATKKCVFNPVFSYSESDVNEDIVSGFQQRKVIHPTGGVKMVPSKNVNQDN